MISKGLASVVGWCVCGVFLLMGCGVEAGVKRPNFVFLLVDDLGWGDFGCYGSEFHETPNIDKLASEGMLFRNAYAACTVCSPSRAAILTGAYPARIHLTDWIAGHRYPFAKLEVPEWNMRMEHERVLLPEALREGGYATAFIGKWHLMPIGEEDFAEHYPTDHGFDRNVGGREWGQPKGRGKYFSPFGMPNLDEGEGGDFLTDKLTDAAVDFLEVAAGGEEPFLLYFSYYTLHGPIMAPPELVRKYEEKGRGFKNKRGECVNPGRAGMVEKLDESVGRLMAKLEELGVAEDTVVILTGDNGGDTRESSGGLREYKAYAYEGGVRQPLVVRWPGKTAGGSVCEEGVIGMDFYPTMLEMAGLPLRPGEHEDGVSLVGLLRGEDGKLEREALYWHYPHYHRTDPYGAIRVGDMKLIEFFEDGELELYDLGVDPGERENLALAEPERAQELLKKLRGWRVAVGAQMMSENARFDPARARVKGRR